MPVAAVKPKRTLSDSEMMAYSRNRYADRKLDSRMRQISLEAQFASDRHHREITRWRSFRQESAKTSGWCVEEYPDDADEPGLSSPRPQLAGQRRNIRDFPPSRGSSRRASPARAASATELARSAGFHNEALSRLQKPWAYSYTMTSYNSVYNESAQAARSQAAGLFHRHLACRSRSASDVSDSEDSNNGACARRARGDVARSHAKSNPARGWRSGPSTSAAGGGSSLQGASRVRFDDKSAKLAEGRPRTSIFVTREKHNHTCPRPSTVNGPAEGSTNGNFPFGTSESSDDALTDRKTRPELPPLSPDSFREPLLISGTSDLVRELSAIKMIPANVNGDINNELDKSLNETRSQDPNTAGPCYKADAQNADVIYVSEETNSEDFQAQSYFERMEQASLDGSPRSPQNKSQFHHFEAADGQIGSSQQSASIEFSPEGTALRIPAVKTKRQPPRDTHSLDALKEDLLPSLAETHLSLNRDESSEEVSVDISNHSSLNGSDVSPLSLNSHRDCQAASSEVVHQDFVRSGPITTKMPRALSRTTCKASEAVSRKLVCVRPQTTLNPHKIPQESTSNHRPDRKICSTLPAVLESKAAVGSIDVSDSVPPTNGKEKNTKLAHRENEQTLAQLQSEDGMLLSHSSEQSPKFPKHRQSYQDSVAADVAALFISADVPQAPQLGMADLADSDWTEFKGYRIHNYVRPQDRYKVDPFMVARRERLLQRLSMERPLATSGFRDHVRVEVVFPKQARQRLLRQLVDSNHRPAKGANPGIVHPVLRARIDEFYETLKPFCPSKEDQE